MKARRVVSMILACMLVLSSLAGCGKTEQEKGNVNNDNDVVKTEQQEEQGTEESEYPEYLNMDSAYPIVKDEYKDSITLKVAIWQDDNAVDWDETWYSKYFKEKYNLNLEVETISGSAMSERRNLMLSSGELPDLMLGMGFTTSDIYTYGQEQGMFLKCDEYINETLTPGIYKYLYEEREDARTLVTCPDSHIYSLPYLINKGDEGAIPRLFINNAWLEELNLEIPETLDEFTEAMYKMKEADIDGVGSENVYPFSGGMSTNSICYYLLNALGYITQGSYGSGFALRNGEAVIPVYDMDVYQEYLKLLNQYYTDGIINPNFYTIESTEVTAQLLSGQSGTYCQPVFVAGAENFEDWYAVKPLTSEWHDTPEWPDIEYAAAGYLCISANTEYPELCMRFMDAFFNNETDNCGIMQGNPLPEDYEYRFDFPAGYYNPETNGVDWKEDELPEGMNSYQYKTQVMAGSSAPYGAIYMYESTERFIQELYDENYERAKEKTFDLTNRDSFYRASVAENLQPYLVESFPNTYYIDADTQRRMTDLETVIQPYVKEQVALFVTGERSLAEVMDFKEELKGMGIEELLEIYTQIYENYKNAK